METILGITAEYDPFHNGHAYQIRKARELVGPCAVVCAMSGDFTQRGEPAILDKWERAALAVRSGADLIFELPFIYACQRAEIFARGAVDLLAGAGATHISFGCEAEHPEDLQRLADLMAEHREDLENRIREHMNSGCSRAKGTELSCRELFGEDLAALMLEPNNILALEYLKRMSWWKKERGLAITPVPVRRYGSGYRQADEEAGFAGGTALRQMIAGGEDISRFVPYDPAGDAEGSDRLDPAGPDETSGRLDGTGADGTSGRLDGTGPAGTSGRAWTDLGEAHSKLYQLVRAIILRSTPSQLARGYGIGEGMENRLLREALRWESYDEFLDAMVSRRYTASAIRRILVWLLIGQEESLEPPAYGRVLAASPDGRKVLRELADVGDSGLEERRVPLVVISDGNRTEDLDPLVREAYLVDRKAADMFNLVTSQPLDEKGDGRRHPWMG